MISTWISNDCMAKQNSKNIFLDELEESQKQSDGYLSYLKQVKLINTVDLAVQQVASCTR